jgi:hypothetical protein
MAVMRTSRGRSGCDASEWTKLAFDERMAPVTDQDAFGTRKKALEEEYFRKREQELIEKLQRRAQEAAGRQRLAERTGVADQEILKDLQDLGYTPETVMLLHLIPLVQMAWAEGGVSDRERALIVEAARARGILADSEADRELAKWLGQRPSDDFFERTLRAVAAMLQAVPPEEGEAGRRNLLSYSSAIASASGGILGFGKVSPEELQVLSRITQELERRRDAVKGGGSS